MEIKVQFSHSTGRNGRHGYADIKSAYDAAVKYVEDYNKLGEFAIADILIYDYDGQTYQHLVGSARVQSIASGNKYPNGYAIPKLEGHMIDKCVSAYDIYVANKVEDLFNTI